MGSKAQYGTFFVWSQLIEEGSVQGPDLRCMLAFLPLRLRAFALFSYSLCKIQRKDAERLHPLPWSFHAASREAVLAEPGQEISRRTHRERKPIDAGIIQQVLPIIGNEIS